MQLKKQVLTTSFIILVPMYIGIISGTGQAKSLYAITDHHASTLNVYEIQGDHLRYQAHINVTKYGTDPAGIAIDSNLKLLFITYESSAVIEWVNAETLAQEGFITIPGVSNLAGIVVDEAKQRVYAVERDSNRLYICAWDGNKEKLVLMNPPYVTLTDLGGHGVWGLALDETTGRLYVGNNTTMVHFYDTNNWVHLGMRDVGLPMADVAVDPNNGQHNAYLYIGALYRRAGQGHFFLVKHDLEDFYEETSNITSEIGTVPIGLAVDPDSGLLYTTTSDRQVRVYNCSELPFILTYSVDTPGGSGGAGICVPTKDVSYKWPLALHITDNTADNDCISMDGQLTYTINYGNTITKPSDPNYVGIVNDVVIIDYLPPGVDFDSASDNGVYDANLHTVTWDIGILSPGNTDYVNVTVNVNENAEQGGTIINYCAIKGESIRNTATELTALCHWSSWNPNPPNGATGVKSAEGGPTLCWSPGDKAVQHDVFLGTNEAAVVNAHAATVGIYRGRQFATIYNPGELEWGQTYYWRIDEVYNLDPHSPWKGNIWSFTTADYITVDDFEDYDDYTNRIFETWIDGFGYTDPPPGHHGNSTGSTIGYVDPPFTEQTIVHSGQQSMPFGYNNVTWPFYSMAERTWVVPQDWTRNGVKVLTLWFRGLPKSVCSFSLDEKIDIYTMTAGGMGIGGESDQFHYAYKRLSGVGAIVVKVISVSNTHDWAKAGVMIRDTLDPDSAFSAVYITPDNGCIFQARFAKGADSNADMVTDEQESIKAPYWVKLERRVGNSFMAYYSKNPATDPWHPMGSNTQIIAMSPDVYIGLALTSHNTKQACVAQFADVATTGTVSGHWKSQDIGIVSNSVERLYVAIEDSAAKFLEVNNTDPNATVLDMWQEWNIDLKEFSNAGVNLSSVKKMYIGVGDKNSTTPGGEGMLYFDDFRLYRPRCLPSILKPDNDLSGNCVVDFADFAIMSRQWLNIGTDLMADLDKDSDVDLNDCAALADTWLDELLWPQQ